MTNTSNTGGAFEYAPEQPIEYTLSFPQQTPPIPAGHIVEAYGNFDHAAPNSGWDIPHPMHLDPASNTYRVKLHHITPGHSYEYQIRITDPGTGVIKYFPGSNRNETIVPEPQNISSTHTNAREIYQQMGAAKKAVFDALQDHDNAEGVDGLIDALQAAKDSLGLKDNQKKLFLEIASQVIRNDRSFPMAVRRQFSKSKSATFSDFNDLKTAMEKGSNIYRASVFAFLKTNKQARHLFHLKPTDVYIPNPDHTFHNSKKLGKLFDRLCCKRDRGYAAEYLAKAMESVDETPSQAKNDLINKRHELLKNVLKRISPERVSRLRSQHGNPKKKSFLAELAVQGAIGGVMYTAGFAPALLAWLEKGIAEVGTGVGIRDLIDAGSGENIASLIKDNNIFTQWWRTERSLGSILSHSIGGFLKRSIPLYGPWKHGPESAISEEAEGFEESEHEHEEGHSAEEFIEEACEKAMK